MRKINKNCNLSTQYKEWEEGFEADNTLHPKYTSSKGEYYLDIIMQLYRCQDGLCAYTERKICASEYYQDRNWEDGRYISKKPYVEGQLDHFNPDLKSKKEDKAGRKDWLWDNFFMVHSDINAKVKGSKPVNDILKPDREEYDPFNLLEYDLETHTFLPKEDLNEADSDKIHDMLLVLGVNHVWPFRKSFIEEKLRDVYIGIKSWQDLNIKEYMTSFEMIKNKVQNGEISLKAYFEKEEIEKEGLDFGDLEV